MDIQKLNIKGSQVNKIYFSDIEDYLIDCGFDSDELFDIMADSNECIYISNGFLSAVKRNDFEGGEWHHYFIKDNDFEAKRLQFKKR